MILSCHSLFKNPSKTISFNNFLIFKDFSILLPSIFKNSTKHLFFPAFKLNSINQHITSLLLTQLYIHHFSHSLHCIQISVYDDSELPCSQYSTCNGHSVHGWKVGVCKFISVVINSRYFSLWIGISSFLRLSKS